MKRYLAGLFLLALLSSPAHAQVQGCQNLAIGMMGQCSSGGAVASYSGPGDVVSGAAAWYGLRAYNASYAAGNGKLINITRASDSGTCDILANSSNGGFGVTANCSNGTNNGVSAATFCNATTCAINTMYDQTGNGHNATQATAANQPPLTLSCVNSLPCVVGNNASNYWMNAANSFSVSQPWTATVVAIATSNPGFASVIGINGTFNLGFNGSGTAFFYDGNNTNITATQSAWHSMIFVGNGASGLGVIDNSASTVSGTNSISGTLGLDNQNSGGAAFTGDFTEAGIWGSGFNSTQYGNMCHNQFTYWGTSTSC